MGSRQGTTSTWHAQLRHVWACRSNSCRLDWTQSMMIWRHDVLMLRSPHSPTRRNSAGARASRSSTSTPGRCWLSGVRRQSPQKPISPGAWLVWRSVPTPTPGRDGASIEGASFVLRADYDTPDEALTALRRGDVDAVAVDHAAALIALAHAPELRIATALTFEPYVIAVAPEAYRLHEAVNQALDDLRARRDSSVRCGKSGSGRRVFGVSTPFVPRPRPLRSCGIPGAGVHADAGVHAGAPLHVAIPRSTCNLQLLAPLASLISRRHTGSRCGR
jgi:hypothetical protein